MAVAGDDIKHKQPSVTIGAVSKFDTLRELGINSNRGNRHGLRRGAAFWPSELETLFNDATFPIKTIE